MLYQAWLHYTATEVYKHVVRINLDQYLNNTGMMWNKDAPNVTAVMILKQCWVCTAVIHEEKHKKKHQFSGHDNWNPILISDSKN